MSTFIGYRAPKVAGGGLYNGYSTPRAKQRWEVGQVVNVGFIKGLVVKGRNSDGSYALWQPSTNRRYEFTPHLGISRVEG